MKQKLAYQNWTNQPTDGKLLKRRHIKYSPKSSQTQECHKNKKVEAYICNISHILYVIQ